MGRLRLAREIAERTGSNLRDAMRYVDDVGHTQARRTLRAAEDRTTWRLPATVGVGTTGVLAWRQQNVREAEAIAEQSESASDALAEIVESDLDAEDKAELAEIFVTQNAEDEGSRMPFELFGENGLERTLVTVIVVVIVLGFVLNYAGQQLPQPTVQTGGVPA